MRTGSSGGLPDREGAPVQSNGVMSSRSSKGGATVTHKGLRQQKWVELRQLHTSAALLQKQQQQQHQHESTDSCRPGSGSAAAYEGGSDSRPGSGRTRRHGGWPSAVPGRPLSGNSSRHVCGSSDRYTESKLAVQGRTTACPNEPGTDTGTTAVTAAAAAAPQAAAAAAAAAAIPQALCASPAVPLTVLPTPSRPSSSSSSSRSRPSSGVVKAGGVLDASLGSGAIGSSSRPGSARPQSAASSDMDMGEDTHRQQQLQQQYEQHELQQDASVGAPVSKPGGDASQAEFEFLIARQELGIVDENSEEGSDGDGGY